MRKWFVAMALAFGLASGAVSQECVGTDLIAAMPEAERQALLKDAASEPYGEGLLWRAERGDTRITLFGTYHLKNRLTEAHLAALTPYISEAKTVYLEADHTAMSALQASLAKDPSLMFITEGPTLPMLLEEDEWQHLSRELQRRNIPAFMGAKFRPIWASMMLGISPCEAQTYGLEAKGIDQLIDDAAQARGIPTVALEPYDTLFKVLDGISIEEQIDMIRLFLEWEGDADDVAYTLRERYFAGEVALIWAFSRAISVPEGAEEVAEDFERFEASMLAARNHAWVEKLDAEADEDSFLAVGAAHLPGGQGVLKLLEDRGFTISAMPF